MRIDSMKYQTAWENEKVYKVSTNPQKKYYILEMLPYPSGRVHIGHIRNYTIGDVIARFKRGQGYDVLHPMGWDAFGLPAENAAKQHGLPAKQFTKQNIASMKEDLRMFGFSYDWDLEITTCDPSYYVHTQKLFIDLYNKGLVYKAEAMVNWDPVEQTVLANEQVVDGLGWRSGAVVEQRSIPHWFFKITDYAEDLLSGLDNVDWPEHVKTMQRNWIGKSIGCTIDFEIESTASQKHEVLSVFTTKPETIYGATFIAISSNHALAQYISNTSNMLSTSSKLEPNIYAIHPLTGVKLPIVIGDYVLDDYGTGAILGVPAHDDRDRQLANGLGQQHISVIDDSGVMINSHDLDGLDVLTAREQVIQQLIQRNAGKRSTHYKLRDWGVSRQRDWGCPIPITYCDKCGPVCTLNPSTICPTCEGNAVPETETLDTFVDSAWYFFRYAELALKEDPLSATHAYDDIACSMQAIKTFMPVDLYIGGIEHAVMHLLYARFFAKAFTDDRTFEPFSKLLTQGMVLHPTYKVDGQYIYPEQVEEYEEQGVPVEVGPAEKMSKSVKNDVNLKELIKTYSADVIRMSVISDSPPEQDLNWNRDNLDSCWRFVTKVTRIYSDLIYSAVSTTPSKEFDLIFNGLIQDLHAIKLNTFIAKLRMLFNFLRAANKQQVLSFLQAFGLVCPVIAQSLYERAHTDQLAQLPWFVLNPTLRATAKLAVQVDGKVSTVLTVEHNLTDTEKLTAALEHFSGEYKRVLIYPGAVNFLTREPDFD